MASSLNFDPQTVNLDNASQTDVICYLQLGKNEYNGRLGVRISALFVILIVSSAATFFPVVAARYFGAGVIIATAFIQ